MISGPAGQDRPLPSPAATRAWGSDAIAEALREAGLEYVALNPGSSFRGLHDSIVNLLGNTRPQLLLCLHEEHAVAIAHGYAKVAGRPMGAMLHSNVGLMHASMAIFNAWADRVPVMLLGAQGPADAARRRPWIDGLHTMADPASLVRPFLRWDNQPASVPAATEAVFRAALRARTDPQGPTYVGFDVALQEDACPPTPPPSAVRFQPPPPPTPGAAVLDDAARRLSAARNPVILAGRMARTMQAWDDRVALAERLGATVLSDRKAGAVFPTEHPLHPVPPGVFLSAVGLALLRAADVVLSLDWIDLAGTLRAAWGEAPVGAWIIHASCDEHAHHGASMEHQGLPPVDTALFAPPEPAVAGLLARVLPGSQPPRAARHPPPAPGVDGPLDLAALALALRQATTGQPVTLVRVCTGWPGEAWPLGHPLDFLGSDGGAGVGSGPGLAVGAALALLGSGRLAVAVLGDGDTLMGITALWTAARYRIPLLVVVANNRSFFNDELHQDRMALARARPPENRGIGIRIEDPAPDIAGLARAQGLVGVGPVRSRDDLARGLAACMTAIHAGTPALIDVHLP